MTTNSDNILTMIKDRQEKNQTSSFDYLKSIQEDIKLSCDEIIQLVSGRRFCEDDDAEPFQPLTEEQQKLAIIQSVADIIEQVNVYMPRHLDNKAPIKSSMNIKKLIRDLENHRPTDE